MTVPIASEVPVQSAESEETSQSSTWNGHSVSEISSDQGGWGRGYVRGANIAGVCLGATGFLTGLVFYATMADACNKEAEHCNQDLKGSGAYLMLGSMVEILVLGSANWIRLFVAKKRIN